MKKYIISAVLIVCAIVCYSGILFSTEEISRKDQENTYKELELFAEALAKVQVQFVDKKEAKDLIYGALGGLLSSLDPYSQFLDKDAYKDLLSDTEGVFGGLGVEISIKDSLLTVISPLEGTPAWEVGMKSGDRIVKIEEKLTRGMTLTDAVKKLRGEPGTKVKLTILREKEGKLQDFEITRAIIKVKDIKKASFEKDRIAYIKIAEFRENTVKDLDVALSDSLKKGMKAIILDLRNNPGGLLDSAVAVASRFIEGDKLVVYTQARGEKRTDYKSLKRVTSYTQLPMVVLINGGSASGSEIVAGCLQDLKRAVILGTKSFGKASVQTIIPLSDGSALRLTTAKYYTPLGRLIHEEGIYPDILIEYKELEDDETKEDVVFKKVENDKKAKERKEKKEQDVPDAKDEDSYRKDPQILRAIDLLKALLIVGK